MSVLPVFLLTQFLRKTRHGAVAMMLLLCATSNLAHAQVTRPEQDPAQRLLQDKRERERQRELAQPAAEIDVEKAIPCCRPMKSTRLPPHF